jgi:hypothetical protein
MSQPQIKDLDPTGWMPPEDPDGRIVLSESEPEETGRKRKKKKAPPRHLLIDDLGICLTQGEDTGELAWGEIKEIRLVPAREKSGKYILASTWMEIVGDEHILRWPPVFGVDPRMMAKTMRDRLQALTGYIPAPLDDYGKVMKASKVRQEKMQNLALTLRFALWTSALLAVIVGVVIVIT